MPDIVWHHATASQRHLVSCQNEGTRSHVVAMAGGALRAITCHYVLCFYFLAGAFIDLRAYR